MTNLILFHFGGGGMDGKKSTSLSQTKKDNLPPFFFFFFYFDIHFFGTKLEVVAPAGTEAAVREVGT